MATLLVPVTVQRADAATRARAGDADVLLGERASHPMSALIGVPNAAPRAEGAPLRLVLNLGNAFMGGSTADEALLLDGETWRLTARWQLTLGACWSLGIEAGAIVHGGGTFDAGIESWHETFGLPDAGRAGVPRDALRFSYLRGDATGPATLDAAASGLADTQLWVQRAAGCTRLEPDRRTLLRVGLKLPTGRLRDWTGSGAVDGWVDVQSPVYKPLASVRIAASIGLLAPEAVDELGTVEPLAGFGAIGIRYAADPRLALHATVDWHTALFDSELVELGAVAASLATGLSFAPGPRSRFDVQILEDILIDTASDIVLRVALTVHER